MMTSHDIKTGYVTGYRINMGNLDVNKGKPCGRQLRFNV